MRRQPVVTLHGSRVLATFQRGGEVAGHRQDAPSWAVAHPSRDIPATPFRERIRQVRPGLRREVGGIDQGGIQRLPDRGAVQTRADEDKLLPPVAPWLDPVLLHLGQCVGMAGPAFLRHRGPPAAKRFDGRDGPGEAEFHGSVRTGRDPEMSLCADHAGEIAVQHGMDLLRVERPAGAIDEGRNTVFLGFRHTRSRSISRIRAFKRQASHWFIWSRSVRSFARRAVTSSHPHLCGRCHQAATEPR